MYHLYVVGEQDGIESIIIPGVVVISTTVQELE